MWSLEDMSPGTPSGSNRSEEVAEQDVESGEHVARDTERLKSEFKQNKVDIPQVLGGDCYIKHEFFLI